MRPAVDAVLFDCDGTLADSEPIITANIVDALRDLGHTVTAAQVTAVFGPPLTDMAKLLVGPLTDDDVRELHEAYARHADRRRPLIEPMIGAVELLDDLAAHGVPLAMVTNKHEASAQLQIAAFGWQARFRAVVGADSTAHPKPHPAPALHALRLLGVPVERAAFVGDTESDTRCGADAGIPLVIGLTGARTAAHLRAHGATHIVDTLDEVRTLLLGARSVA